MWPFSHEPWRDWALWDNHLDEKGGQDGQIE